MNDDTLKTLSDHELTQLVAKAKAEIVARDRQHKADTIAKIKELAGAAGVSVSIKGVRGRPAGNGAGKSSRTVRAAK